MGTVIGDHIPWDHPCFTKVIRSMNEDSLQEFQMVQNVVKTSLNFLIKRKKTQFGVFEKSGKHEIFTLLKFHTWTQIIKHILYAFAVKHFFMKEIVFQ